MYSEPLLNVCAKYLVGQYRTEYRKYKESVSSYKTQFIVICVISAILLIIGIAKAKPLIVVSLIGIGVAFFRKHKGDSIPLPVIPANLGFGYIKTIPVESGFGAVYADSSGVLTVKEFDYPVCENMQVITSQAKRAGKLTSDLPAVERTIKPIRIVADDDPSKFEGSYTIYDAESDLYNVLGELDGSLTQVKSVRDELPLIETPELLLELESIGKRGKGKRPVFESLDETSIKQSIYSMFGIEKDREFDSSLMGTMQKIHKYVGTIEAVFHKKREDSFFAMGKFYDDITDSFTFSSYNFYCPECNSEALIDVNTRDYDIRKSNPYPPITLIRNSKLLFNPKTGLWRCPLCESVIKRPLTIPKMADEVVFPAFDYLMREHFEERHGIYRECGNRLADMKIDAMKSIEIIESDFQSDKEEIDNKRLDLQTEIKVSASTITSYREQLATFEGAKIERLKRIEKYAKDRANEVEQQNRDFGQKYDTLVAKEMSAFRKDMSGFASMAREGEATRDKMLKQTAESTQKISKSSEKTEKYSKQTRNDIRAQGKYMGVPECKHKYRD